MGPQLSVGGPMTGFRGRSMAVTVLARSLAVLGTDARAEDRLEVFEACTGPELEPRAQLRRDTMPGALTGDCGAEIYEDVSGWFSAVEIDCAAAQMDRCALSKAPATCFTAFTEDLAARRGAITKMIPETRTDAAVAQGGLRGTSIDIHRQQMLHAPDEVDCLPFMDVTEDRLSLPTGTICRAYRAMSSWTQARMYLRMIEAAEAQADGPDLEGIAQ